MHTAPPHAKLKGYKLFLGLFAANDAAAAHQATACADRLKQQHHLEGSARVAAARMHITLVVLSEQPPRPRNTPALNQPIAAAQAAARQVHWPPMDIRLDQALTFLPSGALVLRSDAASDAAIKALRQVLALALRRVGLGGAMPSRTPHLTLLYDRWHPVPRQAIAAPIHWTATEFALVLSHQGLAHHEWLGRWPLRPRTNASRVGP
jgi:2'-5' RNA ligase